jgi:hypothetical protein
MEEKFENIVRALSAVGITQVTLPYESQFLKDILKWSEGREHNGAFIYVNETEKKYKYSIKIFKTTFNFE